MIRRWNRGSPRDSIGVEVSRKSATATRKDGGKRQEQREARPSILIVLFSAMTRRVNQASHSSLVGHSHFKIILPMKSIPARDDIDVASL